MFQKRSPQCSVWSKQTNDFNFPVILSLPSFVCLCTTLFLLLSAFCRASMVDTRKNTGRGQGGKTLVKSATPQRPSTPVQPPRPAQQAATLSQPAPQSSLPTQPIIPGKPSTSPQSSTSAQLTVPDNPSTLDRAHTSAQSAIPSQASCSTGETLPPAYPYILSNIQDDINTLSQEDCGRMKVGAVAVVVWVVVAAWVTAAEVPLVNIEHGRVSGIVEESMKGQDIYSFYGIPYARPPLGKLRFKDPVPPRKWDGTRNASVPAAPCIQLSLVADMMGKNEVMGQEDCLYLNVFTPKVKEDGVLPVMVWLHGGGFFAGSAKSYLPHILLDHDVVLVVVQYRLGVLGFLSTEDSVMPGNLGLKDQTMALEWVQRNIHVFDGDKTRVTIFGESAGGASVHFQMLTPRAEGLFSRAILQSGTALCPWAFNSTPRKVALRVASIVGCPTDQGSESLLVCLQGLEADALVRHYQVPREWFILPNALTPWADGQYLPDHPAQLMGGGRHAKVDVISGVTRDDGAFFVLPALENTKRLEELQYNFSVAGPASLELLGRSEDPVGVAHKMYLHYLDTTHVTKAHAEGFMKMLTDRHFTVCHDLTTAYHAHNLQPTKKTFRYELQHRAEFSFGHILCPSCHYEWVCHADELYYLFPSDPYRISSDRFPESPTDLRQPDDLALRDIITTMWTNFAATGNPTPDASLGFTWEPSTADNLQYLSLTPSPSMQPDKRKKTRRFHNSLATEENLILHPHLMEGRPYDPKDTKRSSKNEL